MREWRESITRDQPFSEWVAQFHPLAILSALAGLQLLPLNQYHLIRLERAVQLAAAGARGNSRALDPADLERRLNDDATLRSIAHLEDPPEGVLVDVVMYHGGNYRVVDGLMPSTASELQLLLRAAFAMEHPESLPPAFLDAVRDTSLAALMLSDAMARRAGLDAWTPAPDHPDELIRAPPQASRVIEAVQFRLADVRRFLRSRGVSFEALEPLISTASDASSAANPHPFDTRPFVHVEDSLVICQPGSIASAVKHHLLRTAYEHTCLPALLGRYSAAASSEVALALRYMGYRRAPELESDQENEEHTLEQVWHIDTDKLCYVLLIPDFAEGFDPSSPSSSWPSVGLGELIYARLQDAAVRLRVGLPDGPKSLLHLVVLVGFGRDVVVPVARDLTPDRTVVFTPEQLSALASQRDAGSLFLWKFAGALDAFEAHTRLMSWSVLDTIAFYRSREESFYANDDAKLTFLTLSPDMARGLRTRAARVLERHAVRRDRTALAEVVHFYTDEDHPIPVFANFRVRSPELVVEGFSCPIWVEPENEPETAEALSVLAQMVDAVAYWLWQATPHVKDALSALGEVPVTIQLHVAPDFMTPALSPSEAPPTLRYDIDGGADRVIVHLPESLKTALLASDNRGERLLLRTLLRGLTDLAVSRNPGQALPEEELTRVVDEAAPLGLKKKVFIIDGRRHPELARMNVPPAREITEHDISRHLEDLGHAISQAVSPPLTVGPIQPERLTEVFRAINDHYLGLLRSRLTSFDPHALLIRALAQNEAVTRAVVLETMTGPTQAACFRDSPSQAKRSAERLQSLNRTAIATRFLVELVATEPPSGREAPSDADLDDLLALAYHYANWGLIGDEVRVRLLDPTVSILGSGRLGVRTGVRRERYGAFHEAKALEDLELAERRWSLERSTEEPDAALLDRMNTAFVAEFGLTVVELVGFGSALVDVGFELPADNLSMPEPEFVQSISAIAELSPDKVRRALEEFSLHQRSRWEALPPACSPLDLFPWQYNRRLSFVRRPLVRLNVGTRTPTIYWGPRHANRMLRALVSNVEQGRYKKLAQSREMARLLGELTRKEGSEFERRVARYLEVNTQWRVFQSQKMRPQGPLRAPTDLGDVDVLAFDTEQHIAWALECKSVNFARSPAEIASELRELFTGRGEEPSRADMHIRRHRWLAANWPAVRGLYALGDAEWTLCSVMVSEEEIPSPYLQAPTITIPVVAFTRIIREGPSVLRGALPAPLTTRVR